MADALGATGITKPLHLRSVPSTVRTKNHQPGSVINPPPSLAFGLFLDASSHAAFFKLRIPVALHDKPKTQLYLFIWPQQVLSLDLDLDQAPTPVPHVSAEAKDKDKDKDACLRFKLSTGPVLVVPKGCPLIPKTSDDSAIIEYARTLAAQTDLALLIQKDLLPPDLHNILGQAWRSRDWKTSTAHADLNTLYGGAGGSVHQQDDATLPSYDDITHCADTDEKAPSSFPAPPLISPSKRRRTGHHHAVAGDVSGASSRDDRVPSTRTGVNAWEEQKALLMQDISVQQSKFFDDVRGWVDKQIAGMEQRCQTRLDSRVAELEKAHQARFQALETRVDLLDEGIENRVWIEVDELRTGMISDFDDLRTEYEEFARNEITSAGDDIKSKLSGSAVNVMGGTLEIP